MNVTIESKPTTNSADFDPIFPDLREFPGDGVFFRVFYKNVASCSYIFGSSVVKYGILSNNRRSKRPIFVFELFFFSSSGCSCSKVGWCYPADKSLGIRYCPMRFMVLHNRHHKVSRSSCNTKLLHTILLRIRVRRYFMISNTRYHESHYVTVLDNPLISRG